MLRRRAPAVTTLSESKVRPRLWCSSGISSVTSKELSVYVAVEPVNNVGAWAFPSSWTAATATPSWYLMPPPARSLATVSGSLHQIGRRRRHHKISQDHSG